CRRIGIALDSIINRLENKTRYPTGNIGSSSLCPPRSLEARLGDDASVPPALCTSVCARIRSDLRHSVLATGYPDRSVLALAVLSVHSHFLYAPVRFSSRVHEEN